jgi:hypothetical protein
MRLILWQKRAKNIKAETKDKVHFNVPFLLNQA